MQYKIGKNKLILEVGDITNQKTDAIVNAANGTLMGGGGVDGAIHRKAGKKLVEACKKIRAEDLDGEKLATGEAVLTKGFELPAGYVIHTVGPVWGGEKAEKKKLLRACYQNALTIAAEHHFSSISFPSISTGVYRFPIDEAAKIALGTIIPFLMKHDFGKVVFVLFSESDYEVYATALKEL